MNDKAMMFVFGIIVGATAFYIGEKIYEKTKKSPDEEPEEVEEEFRVSVSDGDNEYENTIAKVEKEFHIDEDNRINYTKYFSNNGVISDKFISDCDNKDENTIAEGVYGISPDEFGEIDGYDTRTLTYYADGVLTDSDNSIIEDPSELVGDNWKDEFNKFEVDAAYIRNDYIGEDFEILKDLNKYHDLYENNGDK